MKQRVAHELPARQVGAPAITVVASTPSAQPSATPTPARTSACSVASSTICQRRAPNHVSRCHAACSRRRIVAARKTANASSSPAVSPPTSQSRRSATRPACFASTSSAAGALSSKPSLTARSVLRARARVARERVDAPDAHVVAVERRDPAVRSVEGRERGQLRERRRVGREQDRRGARRAERLAARRGARLDEAPRGRLGVELARADDRERAAELPGADVAADGDQLAALRRAAAGQAPARDARRTRRGRRRPRAARACRRAAAP